MTDQLQLVADKIATDLVSAVRTIAKKVRNVKTIKELVQVLDKEGLSSFAARTLPQKKKSWLEDEILKEVRKAFYPQTSGMSKQYIVEMINDRINDDCEGYPKAVDISKLSDERTQQFVDKWYDLLEEGFCEGMAQTFAGYQEDLLKQLAQEIAV